MQNILTFRFQNPLFKTVWNKDSVKLITITAKETLGIEGRAAFYEQTGALRDLIQSHLLQLLALVTMEQPATLESKDIHAAKLTALQQIVAIKPDEVLTHTIRGQYEGYRQEANNDSSLIETYAKIHLKIDTERWTDVPVVIQTGKALDEKLTEITIDFGFEGLPDNQLCLRIQPDEGITLRLQAKRPGLTSQTHEITMNLAGQTRAFGLQT